MHPSNWRIPLVLACVLMIVAGKLEGATPLAAQAVPDVPGPVIYTDPDQPLADRVRDLVRRMSLAEKVAQMCNDAPAIERLHVPAYNYWSEALHGVAREGIATVFPQAIGLAATWDPELVRRVAAVISTEGRAKYEDALKTGTHRGHYGLTFWSPNINIFRDPRWGRGQETYGEDPFLTSRIGVSFIRGLQGDNPKYYKVLACAKHFAVHSGPESERHRFDAVVSAADLWDTYLPQFEAAVREAGVGCVMGAYNAVNGEPACSDAFLLDATLRRRWGFQGYVVSDCGAISDIWRGHQLVKTRAEAAARAVSAGCDLECGNDYASLVEAVGTGLIAPAQLDRALERVLTGRFRLGMFDPQERVPYASITSADNDTPAHDQLALETARDSLVLLKNEGELLPLDLAKIKRLAVVGPNADSASMLVANYHGDASHPVTILQGIRAAAGTGVEVSFTRGCPIALKPGESGSAPDFQAAIEQARAADAVIFVGGLDADLEGEEMEVKYVGFHGGDRTVIELPESQAALLQALHATGKPVIFVNCSGSAIAFPWAAENVPAILQAWYPGQRGGTAVADVLFGQAAPSGRLPVTFYRATADLPAFTDYSMANRTYRFFTGRPLYAFGFGLTYTAFRYGAAAAAQKTVARDGVVQLSVPIENTGGRDGAEVVEVYGRRSGAALPEPIRTLVAFEKVEVSRGQTRTVQIAVPIERLRLWDAAKKDYAVAPGEYEIQVGASAGDIRSVARVTVD
jgi:beta-glucosidase